MGSNSGTTLPKAPTKMKSNWTQQWGFHTMFSVWYKKAFRMDALFLQGSKIKFPVFKCLAGLGKSGSYSLCTLAGSPSHINPHAPVEPPTGLSLLVGTPNAVVTRRRWRDPMNNTVYKLFWNRSCVIGCITGFMAPTLWFLYSSE